MSNDGDASGMRLLAHLKAQYTDAQWAEQIARAKARTQPPPPDHAEFKALRSRGFAALRRKMSARRRKP